MANVRVASCATTIERTVESGATRRSPENGAAPATTLQYGAKLDLRRLVNEPY